MGIRFTGANRFLSKDKRENGILGFSLPNKKCNNDVCIHSTDLCEKYCYGNCVFRHSDSGKKILNTEVIAQENFTISKTDEFINEVCRILKEIIPKRVRIHTTGDFYSLEYFNKWIEIIYKNPGIKFTAYTKSFDLLKKYKDRGKYLPENFNLLLSIYPDTYDTYIDVNGNGEEYVRNLIDELQKHFNTRKYIVCSKERYINEFKKSVDKNYFCSGGTSRLKDYYPSDFDKYKRFFIEEGCETCLKCYSEDKSPDDADIYAVLRASSKLADINTVLKKNKGKYPILERAHKKYI